MHVRSYGLSLSIIVASLLAGCVSKGDFNVVQSDIDEMKGRSFRLEKELAGVQSYVKDELAKQARQVQEEASRLRSGTTDQLQGTQKDLDDLRKGTADLQANLDSVKVDMRSLSGKMDDLSLLVKKPGDDLALLREDMERRLAAVEERLKKLEKGLEETEKKATTKEEGLSPEALYQQGLTALKGGNPQQARDLLTRFVTAYPKHDLAANAQYWIGETYYSEKNYEQAILEFQQLIKNYPGREKVPAALLKQGMAFKELGDLKSARYVYNKLLDDYPSSAEAKLAKERLKDLK
jgi:tol-pal system protein YbgF